MYTYLAANDRRNTILRGEGSIFLPDATLWRSRSICETWDQLLLTDCAGKQFIDLQRLLGESSENGPVVSPTCCKACSGKQDVDLFAGVICRQDVLRDLGIKVGCFVAVFSSLCAPSTCKSSAHSECNRPERNQTQLSAGGPRGQANTASAWLPLQGAGQCAMY